MATKSRDTAFTLGQFAEVNSAVTKALPKALAGLDPKTVLDRVGCGQELEAALREALSQDVAGPVPASEWFTFTTTGLSLSELWCANNELFYGGNDRWWKNEKFAKSKGKQRAITLRLSAVPNSFSKSYSDQLLLLEDGELNPTIRETVDGMIQYYHSTGKRIFSDCWVRCSDLTSHGGRVVVYFHADRINVDLWVNNPDSSFGLAARKS